MAPDYSGRRVTVFGGTGFLGRRLVRRLSADGYRVRVAVRHPGNDPFEGESIGIERMYADVAEGSSVARAVEGADCVVNTVGLYTETGRATFHAIHVAGAREVARRSAATGAQLLHISGIGADPGSASRYVTARGEGELAVREEDRNAVILRPGVLFGEDDAFLCSLLGMVRGLPLIPIFGRGSTRLQPVHVDDVARAAASILSRENPLIKTYELGGPAILTYRELLETIARSLNLNRLFLPVPFTLWDALATVISLLPNPPVTRDQVVLMRGDNVASPKHGTFRDLGLAPRALEDSLSLLIRDSGAR